MSHDNGCNGSATCMTLPVYIKTGKGIHGNDAFLALQDNPQTFSC